jgi:hypothetical protein
MLDAVEDDGAAALQNVVQLGRTLVIMELGSVDVYGVRPRGGGKGCVFATDEPVSPTAGTPFSGCLALVADQDRAGDR